jgi:hypothetical protein
MASVASSWVLTVGTNSPNVWPIPRLPVLSTAVSLASSSNTRRENMVGESTTELTFRNSLWAL